MNGHIQAVTSFLFLTPGITPKATTKRLRSNYVLELLTLGASIPYGPGEISGASVADHCCFTGFYPDPIEAIKTLRDSSTLGIKGKEVDEEIKIEAQYMEVRPRVCRFR